MNEPGAAAEGTEGIAPAQFQAEKETAWEAGLKQRLADLAEELSRAVRELQGTIDRKKVGAGRDAGRCHSRPDQ